MPILRKNKGSNKQPNLYLKDQESEEEYKPKISRRQEITKVRTEKINIETRKTIEKTNKSKSQFFEKIKKNKKKISARLRN